MEMGVDHVPHIGRGKAHLGESIVQLSRPGRPVVFDAVDLAGFCRLLVPDPRIDQNESVVMLDEQTPEGNRHQVAIVRLDPPAPERLWHDAEHRPTIEVLKPSLDGVTGQLPDPKRGNQTHASSIGVGEARRFLRFFFFRRRVNSSSSWNVSIPRSAARSNNRESAVAVATASPAAR